jgi:hypothetical protein
MSRPTQDALREREFKVADRARAAGQRSDGEIRAAINKDRRMRWAPLVKAMTVPPELKEFAAEMTARHGPKVRVWENDLDLITALLVARYGEAEYFWPETFGDDDVRRAQTWMDGSRPMPGGVTYIVAEEA